MKKLIIFSSLVILNSCTSPQSIQRQIACVDCEQAEPIDQSIVTQPDFCAGNQKGSGKEFYYRGTKNDTDAVSLNIGYETINENKSVGAYDIYVYEMGPSFTLYEDGVEYLPDDMIDLMFPKRTYSVKFMGRGKEGTFEVIDSPVRTDFVGKTNNIKDRYVSTDMRITTYSFFPRKNVPAIKIGEQDYVLKLTTGEEIVMDRLTGRIISGVAKEGPATNQLENRVDAQGNKNTRLYPDNDFVYEGSGLYIVSKVTHSKDERKPGSIVPVRAMVDGKLQECKLRSEDLWIHSKGYYLPEDDKDYYSSYWSCTRYKFQTDEELYQMIRKKCPTFKFPALAR